MKSAIKNLILCAMLGAAASALAAPVLFPNGDFETAGGASWGISPVIGSFSFPASGGNPGGYAEMGPSQPGGYAVLISNNDQPYPLASLGLVAGNTYTFSYDMITSVAGANKGGVKLESWSSTTSISNSGDQRVTSSSTGWTTYTYNYTIAPNATHLKIVPLWTPGETVGFDNIKVNNTPVVPPPIVPFVTNGDFEIPGGASWAYYTDGFGLTYPTTGGNPGGNAVINATGPGGYGVLVAFSNTEKTLASLGLTAGGTYTFQMDMKIISGSNVGGLKLEGPAGYVYESRPAKIGDGTAWATYSFEVTFPPSLTQFKIVPLWGIGSEVAYDNVRIQPPAPFTASIAKGKTVSWTPTNASYTYQPQESANGTTWTNLGTAYIGTTVNTIFDTTPAAFYQVAESNAGAVEAVMNGDFEIDDGLGGAGYWNGIQSQPPIRITTDSHGGTACEKISVLNVGATPAGSEMQQNTVNSGGPAITPGNTYNFSFWAKQISSGPSYVQRYKVSWLDGDGIIKGDSGWFDFVGGTGSWAQLTKPGLVAPTGAATALIQILGVTGAVEGGLGEVLIDDVTLVTGGGVASSAVLPATVTPAVEISWPSIGGKNYQVKSSTDLSTWGNLGGVIPGNGSIKTAYDAMIDARRFYQVLQLP